MCKVILTLLHLTTISWALTTGAYAGSLSELETDLVEQGELVISVPTSYLSFILALLLLTLLTLLFSYRKKNKSLSAEIVSLKDSLNSAQGTIDKLTYSDALTGLYNMGFADIRIQEEVDLVLRDYQANAEKKAAELVFFMVQLDKFSGIAEHYGEDASDTTLVQLAEVLRQSFRNSDLLFRWGKSHCLVVARGLHRRQANYLAERLREKVRAHCFKMAVGIELRLSCSIGYAPLPIWTIDPAALSWQQTVEVTARICHSVSKTGGNAWFGIEAKNPDCESNLSSLTASIASLELEVASSLKNNQHLDW